VNCRIRLVTYPGGVVTTLAGSGSAAFADGMGAAASFNQPYGVALIPSSGVIVVTDRDNQRIRLITLPAGLPACDSAWHHVALTYAPSASPYTLTAFLDGALFLASAAAISLPPASSSTLRVGWSGDLTANGGSLFAGSLSDLRIYARALLTTEIAALSQPPLAAYLAAYPNTLASPSSPTAGATLYVFSCAAGFAGAIGNLSRSGATGVWSISGAENCTACAAGSWSAMGAPSCTLCPVGTYSPTAGGLATSPAVCISCAAGTSSAGPANGCTAQPGGTSTLGFSG
jgi:hypothetical protein